MFNYCYKYLEKYRTRFYLYIFFTFILGLTSMLVPFLIGRIIDTITVNKEPAKLYFLCAAFFTIQFINIIIRYISNKIYIFVQTNTAYVISLDLIEHVQNLRIFDVEKIDTTYMNQRINNDSNAITSFSINLIIDLVTNIITALFSIIILFIINPTISIFLTFLGFIYIFIYIIMRKKVYNVNLELKEQQAKFFSSLLVQLKDIKFIRRHSLINIFHKKINETFNIYLNKVLENQKFIYVYSSLESIISLLANIFVFLVGGLAVINGKTTIGLFSITISYFKYIISSFKYFSNLGSSYQNNLVSFNRIKEILSKKKVSYSDKKLDDIVSISCSNLSYDRNDLRIISNFNYEFIKGHSYCIYGENGFGKTTLLDLITGLYDDYSGLIKYNQVNIKDLDLFYLRKYKISILEQNVLIFPGSIESNILLDDNYKIKNNALYKYDELGYIKEDNSGISGGEKQKIGLLRQLSKNANIYIFDEPTNALDFAAKKTFMKYINVLKRDKIIIIVSHDSDIIEFSDFKLRLERG